jgi:hypothetical protein
VNDIQLRQRESWDVIRDGRVIGSVSRYAGGGPWSAHALDKAGNLYGLETYSTRTEAVTAITVWGTR